MFCNFPANLQQPDEVLFSSVVIDATCGNSDGSITINASGGSGNYNYSINNGASFQPSNTFNTLPSGSYDVVVRDGSDCTSSAPVGINNIAAPLIQSTPVSDVSCNGAGDGTITINVNGGTAPLSYSIDGGFTSQSSNVFNSLGAGNLNIVVTDANGCEVTGSVVIVEPAAIVLNPVTSDATCGNNDGSVTVTVNGGTGTPNFSMNGSAPQGSGIFNNLGAGNYNILVTDASGCTAAIVASVSNTNSPAITASTGTAISCNGLSDGSITITASGGTGAITYSIDNGVTFQSSGNFTSLVAGTYSIVITDVNGCIASGNVIIEEPDPLVLNTLPSDATCGNDNRNHSNSGFRRHRIHALFH